MSHASRDPQRGDRRHADRPSGDGAVTDEAATDEAVVARPPGAERAGAPRTPLDLAGTATVGFAMGAADVVPGFSGGTVALVAGIYPRLVTNIRQGARVLSLLARGRVRATGRALAAIEWGFLVSLLAGIVTAVLVLAATLEGLLEDQPVLMSAVFLGLIVGAAVLAIGELEEPTARQWAVVAVAAVIAFAGLGLREGTVSDPAPLHYLGAGAVAVCAMILPGVSGSFLLLLLGMYDHVLGAVAARDVVAIGAFVLGCVAGLASFATLLHWALRRFHDVVLAALIGLMIGSVRVLWPWPSGDGVGDPTLGAPVTDQVPAVLLASGLALVVVLAIGAVARRVAEAT